MKKPFEHLWLKLFALLLAATIWIFVSAPRRERPFERSFELPLAVVGLPRDLIIVTPVPDSVNVRLRARLSTLRSLSSQSMEVTLDLSDARAGETTMLIRTQSITLPPEVEAVTVNPPRVSFRIEPRRQKVVPIRPFFVGQLPSGYQLGAVAIVPPDALVSGPASLVREITEVATDRIILSGRSGPFRMSASVVSDSPLVRVVEPVSAQVSVDVTPDVVPVTTETGQ